MVGREGFTGDAHRRLANHYEVAVRSLATLRGYSSLGDSQIGRIVNDAVAGASAEERRNPDHPPTSSFNRLEGLLRDAVEADRPRNIHSAEAARLAQLGAHGAAGLLGHKGYAELQQARREAARDARDGGERGAGRSGERYGELPAAGDRVSAAVTSAYVQQYAGTGLGRGTVQTFAEIGLQRGVYDAYRKEGKGHEVDQHHGLAAGTKDQDTTLEAERAQERGKPAAAKVRVAKLEAGRAKHTDIAATDADDAFKVPSKPTPPTRVAEAKPASPGPKAG